MIDDSKRDPHAAREARRYARPIASREFIMEVLGREAAPLGFDALAAKLALTDEEMIEALRRRLGAMERDGQIVRNRRGGYGLAARMDLVRGRVIAHRDGFGFLAPDEGGEDLFLSPRQMRTLMHGDRALVRVVGVDGRGRREGALVEVIERATRSVVGRLYQARGMWFVEPDNRRIVHQVFIPDEQTGGAREGQIVVAALEEYPGKRSQPIGRVIEVLGEHMAPGMEIDVAIRSHQIPEAFPAEVLAEARSFGKRVEAGACEGRRDLRDLPLVTIDGADARDFDDAVYCARRPRGGWRLLVAIADVASYVLPGTALDTEANERGNSVYFPERVIPMLPEALSNGLCSLVPGEDRLCMVCEMRVEPNGEVTDAKFSRAVMRSHARLTYAEVAAIVVSKDAAARAKRAAVLGPLEELYALYRALREAREARGALDIDTVESRIVFGADRKIERIEALVRNDAHRMIEECMVAANVAAAGHLTARSMPVLYRVHDGPTAERLTDLRAFLAPLGLRLGGGARPRPNDYATLIERVRKRPDRGLIGTVVLRSLAQAVYAPQNIGHFGLAVDCYVHFTSPIRRYADLLVHRALYHLLSGRRAPSFEYTREGLVAVGEHISMTERRADEATRDALDWLKCEFMMERVGERFAAHIASVTSFGIFVVLDDFHVEGLVHISALGHEYFHYDPIHHRLTGERGGRVFRLGDALRVRLVRVDLDERKIDFELEEGSAPRVQRGPRRRGPRRRR